MDLEKVSMTLSASEDPEKELSRLVENIKALPLTFYDEYGDALCVKAKFSESDEVDIEIEPILNMGAKKINFGRTTGADSCIKFEKVTPEFVMLVCNTTFFSVILKTEEN